MCSAGFLNLSRALNTLSVKRISDQLSLVKIGQFWSKDHRLRNPGVASSKVYHRIKSDVFTILGKFTYVG